MNMIEFDEIQKIWNAQKGETMYVINEKALHQSVTRKKSATSKRINRAEIKVSAINGIIGFVFLVFGMLGHPLLFLSAGLMAATVTYVLFFRWKRRKAEDTFDLSLMGELDHALSNAGYIIRLNYFMLAYTVAFVVITITQMIVRNDSWQEWVIVFVSVLLAFFIVWQEQRRRSIPGKNQLLNLKKKLLEE